MFRFFSVRVEYRVYVLNRILERPIDERGLLTRQNIEYMGQAQLIEKKSSKRE